MSIFSRKTLLCGVAVFGAALVTAEAQQQQQKANMGKIVMDAQPSPNIQSGNSKSFKPKDWMEAEVEMKIATVNPEQKKTGFIDQITVKWHVAFKNPDGRGVILLSKDITHVNVPVDETVYSSIYLSPNTLKRITGKDRFDKGAIEAIAAEVLVGGVKVGESSTMNGPWWTASSVSDQSSRFPLMNKNETPFKALWWDRYADIQEKP